MLRVADSIEDLLELRDWIPRQPFIALDTETSGLDIFSPTFKVRTIQLGNRNEAWFVPFERWQGFVADCLKAYDGKLIIHNSAYDIKALSRYDIRLPWHQIDDTMIAMRLAEPHKKAGLKAAATRHVSRSAAQGQDDLNKAMRQNKWTWATVPLDLPSYIYYSSMDVILLARLWETDVCKEGVSSPVYPMEMDVRALCTRMEERGMRIDRAFCTDASSTLTKEIERVTEELSGMAPGVNTRSNPEFGRWLEAQGEVISGRTASGGLSVDKDSLDEILLVSTNPKVQMVIQKALRLRKLHKVQGSYIDNFLGMSDENGFLHPSIETIAAKTGRQSIRDPALQTLPADGSDPDYGLVRQAVIPREEGHLLVSADYDQIELRNIAWMSEDPMLIGAFHDSDASGIDFFTSSMRTVYGDPSLPKSDRRRHGIKTLFYAFAYGAGIEKIAATAGMPVPEMTEIRDRVLGIYPGMKRLMTRMARQCKDNDGWIETVYGRKIYVDPDFAYKALNAYVQGSSADILKDHMVELGHAGFEDLMVVPVHDEILFSLPEDEIDDARPVIEKTLTDLSFAVPLTAGPSPGGETWAELK